MNAVAALLFLAGAAFYLRAWVGMEGLRAYRPPADAPLFSGMARFNHFAGLSRIGVGLALGALGVAVLAAIAALLVRRLETRSA